MAVEFQMPKLGLTMEEGTIIEWLVDDGAAVEQGTPVLTIETDKVESEVEASHGGILHITGQPGELFACGERIGWFLEAGERAAGQRHRVGPAPGRGRGDPLPHCPTTGRGHGRAGAAAVGPGAGVAQRPPGRRSIGCRPANGRGDRTRTVGS